MNAVHALHSEADYQAALADVRQLWGAGEGTPEGDRLELLLILTSAYEDEHFEIEPPDPIDAVAERMDDLGLSRAQLGEMLGVGSGRVSEILNRRRALTVEMIRLLADGLGLSEHCLVQPYELERQRA
jgi:HTH-type transcriptional regulator/antitoxin HigA